MLYLAADDLIQKIDGRVILGEQRSRFQTLSINSKTWISFMSQHIKIHVNFPRQKEFRIKWKKPRGPILSPR